MADQYVSVDVEQILVGEELPFNLYIYLDFRFITFRGKGDTVDRATYDRLEFKRIKNLFVQDTDHKTFIAWVRQRKGEKIPALSAATKKFAEVREDVHRKTMDIFQTSHSNKVVTQTLESSKRLVNEVMKFPFAVSTLSQLQTYSRGTVDHSVNVSVLSVYLAMQMGYSHALILQHVGMGGLLHDIGKPRIDLDDNDTPAAAEAKMRLHPDLGVQFIEKHDKVPNEVLMIIAQHHENNDGTGFPKKLRGSAIYDLARIVSIANVFDELVGDGQGTLVERQRAAVTQLDQKLYRRFDPQKLGKALKILKLGI